MNPIVLSISDGAAFFIGQIMALIAGCLLLSLRKPYVRSILTVCVVLGVILVVISATPLPLWMYALWLIPVVVMLIFGYRGNASVRLRWVCAGLLLVATVGICLAEIPFHLMPRVVVPNGKTIYVLGDSISAGMGTGHQCWPEVLRNVTGYPVVNLAKAGATVESAQAQAQGIAEPGSVVIVEIGGNDLLGGTPASVFREQLDSLISSLHADHHQVLMLELPLFPFRNAFGAAQRCMVRKYDIQLLPKRCFADVLGTKDGTLDGLHLSQEGHNRMAEILAGVLEE